ncbi:hypothetical protein [Acinetobacter lwoffii]|uniref:hypothetical protein n=1 Tax=Acinetobacter lwoffii TaxID=28090 RepID=UPI003009A3AD
MNFKDVAHKTVAELFDMLKAKEATIQEMDQVIKLQDADLRKYEKQIESLKEQLNNMEACYIEKKKEVEAVQHQKSLQELEISQISQANQEWQKINGELAKALRGAND